VWWDVLKVDGVMTGFSSSFVSEGTLKIDKLYVHPSHQRQGYGGMLIAHACDRARRLGFDRVVLAVNKHNSSAIAAYRKHGFDIVDAVVKDIGGDFVMDDYVMAKRVEAS
jgi:ribosomal protein S18 acetylase RimI-like enzyme